MFPKRESYDDDEAKDASKRQPQKQERTRKHLREPVKSRALVTSSLNPDYFATHQHHVRHLLLQNL